MYHIINNVQGLEALKASLKNHSNVVEKAMASALNKLGAKGVTAANRGVRETYNIKASDVSKAISRIPAKASSKGKEASLTTIIVVKGGRLPLIQFGGRPTKPPNQAGVPVARRKSPTVQILKAGPRRPVSRDKETGHGAFVARMASGHVGIFVRSSKWLQDRRTEGKPKLRRLGRHQIIRELKNQGIAACFASRGRETLDKLVAEEGPKILQHELEFFLEKERK